MTIATEVVSAGPFTPDSATTTFPFPFPIMSATEVVVYQLDANGDPVAVSPALYSAIPNGGAGSIVFETAPVTGSGAIYIQPDPVFEQPLDLEPNGPFLAQAVMEAFDRTVARDLVLRDGIDRSFQVPPTEVSTQIPTTTARAGKLWLWGPSGEALATSAGLVFSLSSLDFPTVALAVAATLPAGAPYIQTFGYDDAGDGREAVWFPSAVAGPGNGLIQTQDGQWWSIAGPLFDPNSLGVCGVPGTDDAAKFTKAASLGPLRLTGIYYILSDLTISVPIEVFPGAQIHLGNGVTLTFNGSFRAPVGPLFYNATAGQGTVVFGRGFLNTAYPEWWGALTDNSGGGVPAANLAAFDACVLAAAVVTLQAADYYLSNRWLVSTNNRTIHGWGRNGQGGTRVTRVILPGLATTDVFMIGTDAQPGGGINAFVQFVDVKNITFVSAVAPAAPSSGILGGPSCARMQYALNCTLEDVCTVNGSNGFYITGAVFCGLKGICQAQRGNAGTTTANDYFIGCVLDSSPNIGANTGLASCYIERLSVTGSALALINYGVYAADGFTDLTIDWLETSGVENGIVLNGNPSAMYGSEDFKCLRATLDQVQNGIYINAGEDTTAAILDNFYIAVSAASNAGVGVTVIQTPVSGVGGSIKLRGQVIGGGGNTTGLSINGSTGVQSEMILTDLNNPIVLLNAASCILKDQISNPTQAATTAAIQLTGSARCVIEPSVDGMAGAFPVGVDLVGSGNSVCELRMTAVDPGSITGVAATGSLVFTVNPTNGQNIVLDGVTWGFVTAGATATQTNLGGSLAATLTQLRADLAASANSSIALANYAVNTTTLTVTYKTTGPAGNAYTLTGGTTSATPSGGALTGGVNNKLLINGSQITAAGASGTHLVQGLMV